MQDKIQKAIHHLRQQPEHNKRQILHGVTIIAGLVLIVLWTWSLGSSLSSAELREKFKKDLEPFAGLKNDVVGEYQSASVIELNQE
jgi:hypothetical protein